MKNLTYIKTTIFLHCICILSISGMEIAQKPYIDLSSTQAQNDLQIFGRNTNSLIEDYFNDLVESKDKTNIIKKITFSIDSMVDYIKKYDFDAGEYRIGRLNEIKDKVPDLGNQIIDLQQRYFEKSEKPVTKQEFLGKGNLYLSTINQWGKEIKAIEQETIQRIQQKKVNLEAELFQSSLGVQKQLEKIEKEKSEKIKRTKNTWLDNIDQRILYIESKNWSREVKVFLLQLMYWEMYRNQEFLKEENKTIRAQLETQWLEKLKPLGESLYTLQATLPKITHEYGETIFPKFTYEINIIPEDAPQELKDIFNNFKNMQREIELKSPYWKLEAYVSRIQKRKKQLETEKSYLQSVLKMGTKAKEWLLPQTQPIPLTEQQILARINKSRREKKLSPISLEYIAPTEREILEKKQLERPTEEQNEYLSKIHSARATEKQKLSEKSPQEPSKILSQKIEQSIQADQQEIKNIVSQEISLLETQIKQKDIDPFMLQGMRYKIVRLGEYIEKLTDQIKILEYNIFRHVPVHDEINYSSLENNYFLGVLLLTNECGKTQNEKYLNKALIFQLKHIYSSSIHQLFISFDDSKNESQLFKIRSNYIKKDSEGKTTIDITKLKKDVYTAYFSNSKYDSDLYKIIPFLLDAIGLYENYAKIDLHHVLLGLREKHQTFKYIFDAIEKILALKNPWNQEKTIACLTLLDQVCAIKTDIPGTSFFFKNQQKLDSERIKGITEEMNKQNDAKIINAYVELLDTEVIFNWLSHSTEKPIPLDIAQKQINGLKLLLSDEDLKKNTVLYDEIIINLTKYIQLKNEKKPQITRENVANLPFDYFKNINDEMNYLHTLMDTLMKGSPQGQTINTTTSKLSKTLNDSATILIDHIIEEIKANRITPEQAQQKVIAFFGAEDIEGSTLSTIKSKAINLIKEKSEQKIAETPPPTLTDIPVTKLEEPKIEIPSEKPVATEPPAESETEQKEKERKSLEEEILLRKIVEEREKREQENILEEEILKEKQPVSPEPSIQEGVKDNEKSRQDLAQTLREKVILESNIKFEKPLARNILENALVETLKTNVSTVDMPFSKDVVQFINHIMDIGTAIEQIKTQEINIPYDLTPYISALATHPLLDKKSEKSLMNISPEIFKNNKLNFVLFREACTTIHRYFKDFPVPEEIPVTVAPQQILQQKKPQAQEQPEQPVATRKMEQPDKEEIYQNLLRKINLQKTGLIKEKSTMAELVSEINENFPENDPNKKVEREKLITELKQLFPQPEIPEVKGGFLNTIFRNIIGLWNKIKWYLSW